MATNRPAVQNEADLRSYAWVIFAIEIDSDNEAPIELSEGAMHNPLIGIVYSRSHTAWENIASERPSNSHKVQALCPSQSALISSPEEPHKQPRITMLLSYCTGSLLINKACQGILAHSIALCVLAEPVTYRYLFLYVWSESLLSTL